MSFLSEHTCKFILDCANHVQHQLTTVPESYQLPPKVELYIHGDLLIDSSAASIGTCALFKALERLDCTRVQTLHGYGIGAVVCALYACDIAVEDMLHFFVQLRQGQQSAQSVVDSFLPTDSHVLCSGRICIDLPNERRTQFETRESLVQDLVLTLTSSVVSRTIRKIAGHMVWKWPKPQPECTGIELFPAISSHTIGHNEANVYNHAMKGAIDTMSFIQNQKSINSIRYMVLPLYDTVCSYATDYLHTLRKIVPTCEIKWKLPTDEKEQVHVIEL